MEINSKTTICQLLLANTHIYSTLIAMGLCCVNEENITWSMERLARELNVDISDLCTQIRLKIGI